jgi:phosphoenolpyruvate synthase/pyruvate phosphate dikinase
MVDIITIAAGIGQAPSMEEIGAKAANLARVAMLGLPVPPAFVLPVQLGTKIIQGDRQAEAELTDGLVKGIQWLESATGKRFGDRCGITSGAGVAFSRNPSTGATQSVIDMLFDAQGEDVVSGRRTPETESSIVHLLPALANELNCVLLRLEREFRGVQDVEFTIEDDRLWILQTGLQSGRHEPPCVSRWILCARVSFRRRRANSD